MKEFYHHREKQHEESSLVEGAVIERGCKVKTKGAVIGRKGVCVINPLTISQFVIILKRPKP